MQIGEIPRPRIPHLTDVVLIIVGVFFFFASVLVLTWIVNARGVRVEEKLSAVTQDTARKFQTSAKTSEQAKAEAKAAIDVATQAATTAAEAAKVAQKKASSKIIISKTTTDKLNWAIYQNTFLQKQITAMQGEIDAQQAQINLLQKQLNALQWERERR